MSEIRVRPRTLRRRLALVGMGGILAAAVVTMPAARADVADDYTAHHGAQICSDIAAQPTDKGVDQVALKMFADHLTPEQAASVLYSAMSVFCPWDEAVMRHWASSVTGSVVVA
jgi:hypothetical protein